MEAEFWVCPNCWHEVPINNQLTHQSRCNGGNRNMHADSPAESQPDDQVRRAYNSNAQELSPSSWRVVEFGPGRQERFHTADEGELCGLRREHTIEGVLRDEVSEESRPCACRACTFENKPDATSCEMCNTRIPSDLRPPDSSYRDTLLDGDTSYEGRGARVGSGGGEGGGGNFWTIPRISDALTGSAIGALGAGMLNSLEQRDRRGSIVGSMLQGAFLGGTAGAMLGPELRRMGAQALPTGGGTGRAGGLPYPRSILNQERSQWQGQGQEAGWTYSASWPPVGATAPHSAAGEDYALLRMVAQMQSIDLPPAATARIMEMNAMNRGTRGGEVAGVGTGGLDYERLLEQFGTPQMRPAPPELIASLPESTLTREAVDNISEDSRQCSICLENFRQGDVIRRLPCLHSFHSHCVSNWLRRSGKCPHCMHQVDGQDNIP